MEEQVVERKEGLDCTEVPDKVFLGDVETYKVLQRGMDEGKVLEGTLDFGEDQTKVLENSVYMGKAQILKGVGVDQFQHEMSSNIMGMVQNEVLDGNMDVVKIYTVVLEGGSDKDDAIHGNILEDSMDMEVQYKVLDGGIDVNKVEDKFFMSGVEVDKFLEGDLDMDKVQCRVLECRMNADRLQDQFLKGGVEIGKFQDKILKGDVHHLAEDNFLKKNVNVDMIYGTVNMEKVIDEVPEDALAMDMVQNKTEDGVDVDNTLDEVLKCSVNININENGVDLKEAHDMVHEDRVHVKGNLNAQERFDTLRCQVRIITRHNLRLHMANHTTRDVYVRLLGHGERITGSGLLVLQDSVHLSPLKPSMLPEDPDLEEMEYEAQETGQKESSISTNGLEGEWSKQEMEEDDEDGSHAISDTVYSPCSSMMPTPVEETQGCVDFLYQSPGRLLKELHASPEMQAKLWAERQEELTREVARQSLCSQSNGTPPIQALLHSAARLIAVASVLLLFLLVFLLVLLESDLDVSFLQDIRETPEFEQFHYEYYCPLRRWLCYKLELLTEQLWGD